MSKENIDLVISLLKTDEPQTPNEIAELAKLNQKTVQTILRGFVHFRIAVKQASKGSVKMAEKQATRLNVIDHPVDVLSLWMDDSRY